MIDKPLLTVDRQMGLVIVTPDGKVCVIHIIALCGLIGVAYIGCQNRFQAIVLRCEQRSEYCAL